MSDQDDSTDTGTDAGQQDAGQQQDSGKTFSQADLDRIVADRVARERAKYSDYGDLKKKAAAAMTDQERAVAAARTEGATEAAKAAAPRLVRAEFRAAAAGRVDKQTLDAYLEDADLAKFLSDDGEPDLKAIESRIKRLGGAERQTDFDGGARTPAAQGSDMNSLIRRAAGVS